MSFTQSALVIVAIAALVLGLACYHLLSRLDLLERAIAGGLTAPSRRLSREEFEQRFGRSISRAELARNIGHGLLLVVGSEFPESPLESTLAELGRADSIHLATDVAAAQAAVRDLALAGAKMVTADLDAIGVGVTPYLFVVDESRITAARPIASPQDLIDELRRST